MRVISHIEIVGSETKQTLHLNLNTNMKTLTKITGNTYPVKDALKAIGCRWNANDKCWTASTDEMARKASQIVSGSPAKSSAMSKPSTPSCSSYRPSRCKECGAAPTRWLKIYANGICRDCYQSEREEREMGY